MTLCPHLRRDFFRVLHNHGTHVGEFCLDCGANVRGPGRWVPQSELPDEPDSYRVKSDYRHREDPKQGRLFEE